MTAAKKTAHAKPPSRAKSPAAQDAIALLKADHAEVKKLFADYEKLVDAEARAHLADLICDMLTVHTTIEEEIFYPAARGAIDEDDLLDEAEVEHASAKELIAQLEGMQPEDDLYDAKVKVLGEYVAHHVKEEEDELFPAVKKTTLDLRALGSELAARKEEILAEMGIEATN